MTVNSVKNETKGALIFAFRSLSPHQDSYNASRTKKATLSSCRPRNTCYAQWSNLSKVTRKTGLSHTRGHVASKSLSLNRRGRSCSKAEDSSCEKTGIQLRLRKKEVQSSTSRSFPLVAIVFFFFPLPSSYDVSRYASWWVYFDNGREQVRRTARKNESREVRLNYRKRHAAYVLRRGNRGADYARKPVCVCVCVLWFYSTFGLEIEYIREYRTRSHFIPVSSKRMMVNGLLDVADNVNKIKI